MKKALFLCLLVLIILEILTIYFIMPFPGSQKMVSLPFAYWLANNALWLRILLLVMAVFLMIKVFKKSRKVIKIAFSALTFFWIVVFYYANFKFRADKMFRHLTVKQFSDINTNTVNLNRLILGVSINGEAKAYPIQLIGYHHQVRDTLGTTPVMITYCTVCRTGRVFSPIVNGKSEDFRLVGMDHFNAMFEDATTKSWWRQATGVAVAGPLKGRSLIEYPSQQSTLASWLRRYPNSKVLQPDTIFNKRYDGLKDFDNGTTDDALEKRDSASWKFKSWVVGIDYKRNAKAYDWNTLVARKTISDSLPGLPLIITLENDTATFHVLHRKSGNRILTFEPYMDGRLRDLQTGSVWSFSGNCEEGELKGNQLGVIQSSQEFWHSWHTFHPNTLRYQ